jgi:hypothetical protein
MNRSARRASRFKREQRYQADPGAFYRVMARVQPFTPAEQTSLTLPLRLSWQSLCDGQGSDEDFHNLACAANVSLLRAENIDPLLVESVQRAQDALLAMLARHQRTGQWGVDYQSREHIPHLLDIYEQLIELSTPQQMHTAMQDTLTRMAQGQTLSVN